MIIVFEGPDNAGKSTIAKALSEKTGLSTFRYHNQSEAVKNKETYNITKYASTFFADFIQDVSVHCIIDRHYPTEWVYAQVFDRPIDFESLRYIDKGFAAANAFIIICYKSEYLEFVDEHTPHNKIKDIVLKYAEFVRWSCVKNILLLDTTNEDLSIQLEKIESFLYEER